MSVRKTRNYNKKRSKKKEASFSFPKIIFLLVALWFLGNGIYSYLITYFVDTELARTGVLEDTYETTGYIIRDEYVLTAPSSGKVIEKYPKGERISKGGVVCKVVTTKGTVLKPGAPLPVTAPVAGIVSYNIDGLENFFNLNDLNNIGIDKIMELKNQNEHKDDDVVEKGLGVCKVINNLEEIRCFIECPLNVFEKPLEKDQNLLLRFPQEDKEIYGKIIDLKGIGNKAQILVKIPRMCYSLIDERETKLEVVINNQEGVLIPKDAIVTTDDGFGVYWKNKGFVLWQPIEIIEEKDDQVLVDGLDILTEVITTPKLVRKGQYLY